LYSRHARRTSIYINHLLTDVNCPEKNETSTLEFEMKLEDRKRYFSVEVGD
jgi:hypothetical protein